MKRAPTMLRSFSSGFDGLLPCRGGSFAPALVQRQRLDGQLLPAGGFFLFSSSAMRSSGMGDAFQLSCVRLGEDQHGFDGAAVLAFEVVDQIQAFFHLFQAARVEFDLFQVILQVAAERR